MRDWQLIETAPKAGERILVSNGKDIQIARWGGKRPACWKNDYSSSIAITAIFWMPLPKCPDDLK